MPISTDAPRSPATLHFDPASGGRLERLVFNRRGLVLLCCALVSLVFGYSVFTRLALNASYEKMLPQGHPYIQHYQENRAELRGLGSALRVVVASPEGDIFDARYLETLRQINDEIFLVPGVDRAWIKSLWTPAVRWTEVTEEGFRGGPVMPGNFTATPDQLDQLRQNISRAGITGDLVAGDAQSSMIFVPLMDRDPVSGQPLDYAVLARQIAEIRDKYEATGDVKIHIVGFAQLIGELIGGLFKVMTYFVIAIVIVSAILFLYIRCARTTALVVCCSLVAVLWQLGMVALLGYQLDPFSILVPFLVFAIGVSHGAQKVNGIAQDIAQGHDRGAAARLTFRRLFGTGVAALLTDAAGFAVLMVIDIPVIRELALAASVGVAVLVVTNLILLPVLLSYAGIRVRAPHASAARPRFSLVGLLLPLSRLTETRWAVAVLAVALVTVGVGLGISRDLKIGDLDAGAPELRADSRYNLDNAYIVDHYALSSDQFAVIVRTPPDGCMLYDTLEAVDRLAWELERTDGVQTTQSLVKAVRQITAGSYEGNPKWLTISRDQNVINYGAQAASVNNQDLFNVDCSVMPIIAYLTDHKADTLQRVADVVEHFAADYGQDDMQFLLAAGNAGIEAATNQMVSRAWMQMQYLVYGVVILFCMLTFRSWRAVIVAVVPLMVTSVLSEALMVQLGIGVKVAMLPVIALGVGIGVDYALYLISAQLAAQRQGLSLRDAYAAALARTGKVVALVGVTLSASVLTWAWSPIKFQADMGILLAFMFAWNMLCALVMIPALSRFLLPSATGGVSSRPPDRLGEGGA